MPYRRLPNTDKARLRALNTALKLGDTLLPNELAYSQAIYAKIKATFDDPGALVAKSREQIKADSQVRGTEWPKLRATLSPSQRELDEAMGNPQKAMRRKPGYP